MVKMLEAFCVLGLGEDLTRNKHSLSIVSSSATNIILFTSADSSKVMSILNHRLYIIFFQEFKFCQPFTAVYFSPKTVYRKSSAKFPNICVF